MPVLETRIHAEGEAFQAQHQAMLQLVGRLRELEARAATASAKAKPLFDKRHQLLPRERLARLLDPGSPWLELSSLSGWLLYRDDPLVVGMIAIISGSLVLTTLSSCVQPVFVTDVRFGAIALSDLLGRLLSFGLTFLLVHVGADLYWYALVQLIPPLVVLLIQGGVARRIVDLRPIFSFRESWELVRESLPQTGVLVIAALYWRSDGVLLSVLSSKEETGAYNLAYTVAFNATVISTVFLASTLSTMTNLFATDRARFARFTVRSIQLMLFVAVPLAVAGALLAPELVRLLGSEDFVAAGGSTLGLLFVTALGIGTSATHKEWFSGPKGLKFSEIGCRPPGVGCS